MLSDETKQPIEYQPLLEEQARYEAQYGVEEENERVVHESGTRRQIGGAAIAGGVAGVLFLGPFGGLILAGGAAALAASRGEIGDLARSTGTMTSDAVDKIKAYDNEHHVVERTSRTIAKGCIWVSKKLQEKNLPEKDSHENNVQAVALH